MLLYHYSLCREWDRQIWEGADGGVTLNERERKEGRDTVAVPSYFFSGHMCAYIEKFYCNSKLCAICQEMMALICFQMSQPQLLG